MIRILSLLAITLFMTYSTFANKVVGKIGKKGVVSHYNEDRVKKFFIENAGFQSVEKVGILEENGLYAMHILGMNEQDQKILIVKELKKVNGDLILPVQNNNQYMLTKHFCTWLKGTDNNYNLKGVTKIQCECADPYDKRLYNHTITTEVGFDYLAFYNAF